MECVANLRKRLVWSSAILDETLEEEKKTDDALTELAKAAGSTGRRVINGAAAGADFGPRRDEPRWSLDCGSPLRNPWRRDNEYDVAHGL